MANLDRFDIAPANKSVHEFAKTKFTDELIEEAAKPGHLEIVDFAKTKFSGEFSANRVSFRVSQAKKPTFEDPAFEIMDSNYLPPSIASKRDNYGFNHVEPSARANKEEPRVETPQKDRTLNAQVLRYSYIEPWMKENQRIQKEVYREKKYPMGSYLKK